MFDPEAWAVQQSKTRIEPASPMGATNSPDAANVAIVSADKLGIGVVPGTSST